MAGRGLQDIPFRVPEQWDRQWFLEFIRDVLSKLDVRNAIEGAGITIEGTPDDVATLSTSEDLTDLIGQNFILATSSTFLVNERILQGESGVVSTTDAGPGGNFTISLVKGGIANAKLAARAALSVMGRATTESGEVMDIEAGSDDTVLRRVSGALASEIDFGQLTLGMAANSLWTYAKLQDGAAASVVGRAAATSGVLADIASTVDDQFLVRRSGALTFGTLVDGDIPAGIARDAEVAAAYQPINAALDHVFRGSGSPEGVVTADIGSLYLRSDGGAGTSMYAKEANNGANTGWVAK